MRGFDIRTIGPRDPNSNLVIGGNKTLNFNAEYYINIASPVRLVAFFDAGQVQDVGQSFRWKEPLTSRVLPPGPFLVDPLAPALGLVSTEPIQVDDPGSTRSRRRPASNSGSSCPCSTCVRLIGAWNPSRLGVLNISADAAVCLPLRVGNDVLI